MKRGSMIVYFSLETESDLYDDIYANAHFHGLRVSDYLKRLVQFHLEMDPHLRNPDAFTEKGFFKEKHPYRPPYLDAKGRLVPRSRPQEQHPLTSGEKTSESGEKT